MSSDDVVVRVDGLGKRYEVYDTPRDRLKQFFMPRLRRLVGLESKPYHREFWALRDVSFEIRKGEAFGVVGRNGSGKSTLLQLVTGTLAPTTGTVETKGRIAALLELGSGFNPDFTGRENVFLNGMILGLTRREIEDRFDAIAGFADIGDHLEQPVRTYSSGMLVRLAFAVQVQVQPDILIIDEALAVGDALFQKRCFERIERLLSDGVTLMFVSHDQESVRTLTRKALLLKNGRAVACGGSSEVILAYRKQLHEEETAWYGEISRRARAGQPADGVGDRSGALSFGDGGVVVVGVQTVDAQGGPCAVFHPGDRLRLRVRCRSEIDIEHLNVSIRLRSKEGVKVYSWGTLNQDMQRIRSGRDESLFWDRSFRPGDEFDVWLECDCALGANFYEVQACVSHEATPDYQAQRILHWLDEACFFQVLMRREEYFFGGFVDLRMHARWEEAP
jgi:lipopolysaccharide transport system ATP-binding protein